jgi:hypothetical protein
MTQRPKSSTLPFYKFVQVSETASIGVTATSVSGDFTQKTAWSLVPGGLAPYNLAPVTAVAPADSTIKGQNGTASFASVGGNLILSPGVGSVSNVSGNVKIQDTAGNAGWNTAHLMIGIYHLWVDGTGDLRIKNSAPASDTDGTVVGTQT